MSFGYSISDVISLAQLAWDVVQNARKACGEHDELTREVSSLQTVLKRLEYEVGRPESPINKPGDTYREEIEVIASGCHRVLRILSQVLEKYNALSEAERTGRKLWQKIKFGNGQMADLADYRSKVVYYTSAMSLFLNMVSIGTMGSVERQMNDAGGDLKEIKQAVNGITAHLIAKDRSEGSVLTAYADDDRMIWKELRRELSRDGFSSSVIGKHKDDIKAYVTELASRGLFDDQGLSGLNPQEDCVDAGFSKQPRPAGEVWRDSINTLLTPLTGDQMHDSEDAAPMYGTVLHPWTTSENHSVNDEVPEKNCVVKVIPIEAVLPRAAQDAQRKKEQKKRAKQIHEKRAEREKSKGGWFLTLI